MANATRGEQKVTVENIEQRSRKTPKLNNHLVTGWRVPIFFFFLSILKLLPLLFSEGEHQNLAVIYLVSHFATSFHLQITDRLFSRTMENTGNVPIITDALIYLFLQQQTRNAKVVIETAKKSDNNLSDFPHKKPQMGEGKNNRSCQSSEKPSLLLTLSYRKNNKDAVLVAVVFFLFFFHQNTDT